MSNTRKDKLQRFIEAWNLKITRLDNLKTAFIHPTYAFEHKAKRVESNQRLEFLGDAVLGLIVGAYLYQSFPGLPEGELTKMRAALVCEGSLASMAKEIGLGAYLMLGRGEETSGGRERNSLLADCFEAVIGAIYLELGLAGAEQFIYRTILKSPDMALNNSFADAKTKLQELVQKQGESVQYKVLQETGPDHDKKFEVGVYYRDELLAQAWGKNKKEAEQKAAYLAYGNL